MSENGENIGQCLSQAKLTSSYILFCPQPKDTQLTVSQEERNQNICTLKKLESEIFTYFLLNSTQLIY